MNYTDLGEIPIAEANDMNVPINSFIAEPDASNPNWIWTADNFMPRKCYASNGQYHIEAESKEIIMEVVHKYVVPLYEIALNNLKTKGINYYWQ